MIKYGLRSLTFFYSLMIYLPSIKKKIARLNPDLTSPLIIKNS